MGKDKKKKAEKKEVKKKDELAILNPEVKKYKIGNNNYSQRPLVLRQFNRLVRNITGVISAAQQQEQDALELELADITPDTFMKLAFAMESAEKYFYDLIGMLIGVPDDDTEQLDFVVDNIGLKMMSDVVCDFFDMNDIQEVIANFTRMAQKVNLSQLKTST